MEIFSFSPPINLDEEGKKLFAVFSSEAATFFSIISDENINFPFSKSGPWSSRRSAENINQPQKS